jgi:AAA domain (dynein-related subfamily)
MPENTPNKHPEVTNKKQLTERLRNENDELKSQLAERDMRIEELRIYQELEQEYQKEIGALAQSRETAEQEVRADAQRIHQEYFDGEKARIAEIEKAVRDAAAQTREEAEEAARLILQKATAEAAGISESAERENGKLKQKAAAALAQAQSKQATALAEAGAARERILEETAKERDHILREAQETFEAQSAERVARIERREKQVSEGEARLKEAQAKLRTERDDLEWEREELGLQAQSLRTRWTQCSPERVFQAEQAVKDKESLMALSSQALDSLREEIDRLRSLVPVTDGRPAEALLRDLGDSTRRLHELEDRLRAYPAEQEITALRADSEALAALRVQYNELAHRCAGLDMRALQCELRCREAEQLEVQADALRVLNDQLRSELQLHKESLEQRTGERFAELGRLDRHHKSATDRPAPFPATRSLLASVVEHVRQYAAGKGLYYSEPTIRSFLAGLAASRLAILQGLSGTGKTSLPRVFIEAIGGRCETIPVQSSWRDRHELLGYNNDFNKRFSETDFTKAVYESGFPDQEDTVWLIVLDEMNLARIEYYFADFLSVLEEPDAGKRIVSLMDYNPFTLKEAAPKLLIDGHRLRIPENLWFVGTANQDESTFEVTDKVYDRAQILDFRGRQKEFTPVRGIDPRFLPVSKLCKAFDSAARDAACRLNETEWQYLERIDACLRERLDVSFGNRVKLQMEKFVPVYVASGGTKHDAVDQQIARKILRKLEGRFDAGIADSLKSLQEVLRLNLPAGWHEPAQSCELLERKRRNLVRAHGAGA